jgi:Flp pilus assembly protein CpaB
VGSPLLRAWRGRGLRWAVAVVLAVCAGTLSAATVSRAEAARSAYGETALVPVATVDLRVGDTVTAGDVTERALPVGLVPTDAAPDPVGRVVTEPVVAGEVLLERRLAGGGEGVAALLDPGRRAVAVPLDAAPGGVTVGDHVDLYAPATASTASELAALARGGSGGARRVASGALVVAVDERSATVSVTGSEAAATAQAVLDGAVAVALVAPG